MAQTYEIAGGKLPDLESHWHVRGASRSTGSWRYADFSAHDRSGPYRRLLQCALHSSFVRYSFLINRDPLATLEISHPRRRMLDWHCQKNITAISRNDQLRHWIESCLLTFEFSFHHVVNVRGFEFRSSGREVKVEAALGSRTWSNAKVKI